MFIFTFKSFELSIFNDIGSNEVPQPHPNFAFGLFSILNPDFINSSLNSNVLPFIYVNVKLSIIIFPFSFKSITLYYIKY